MTILVSLLILEWTGIPSAALAQDRSGAWFGAGAGIGNAGVACDFCDEPRKNSGVIYLRGGWTLNPHTLVGAEFNLWSKAERIDPGSTGRFNMYNLAGTVSYYPSLSSNLFVKGGMGVAFADVQAKIPGLNVTADLGRGLGLTTGAGYDIRLGRHIALTPAVNVWLGRLGDVKVAGQPLARNWKQNVVDFTIGVTFP